MQISLIYILIIAEVLLVLTGLSITLAVILFRRPKNLDTVKTPSLQESDNESSTTSLGNNYIDFLEQAMERNTKKSEQQPQTEENTNDTAPTPEEDENKSPAPDETQVHLLQMRDQFLLIEKEAAEKTEHEIHFWDNIYDGMKNLLEKLSTIEIRSVGSIDDPAKESKEKVFYIETQGKKIDGEVNKLKDIIYEQENALSSMKKAMENAEDEHPEESDSLKALKEQMDIIERQLSDSRMCMDVLEMENKRLQEEVDNIDTRHNSLFTDDKNSTDDNSLIDLEQMKEVVEQQEDKIQNLIDTIESLEIDATQSEKLKETIGDFSRTSKEMMSCISILEEENERLKNSNNEDTPATPESNEQSINNEEADTLKSTIGKLEEDIIKKDVAFAQLQDEFSSMETEYLAMYEAMHGNNS